MRITCCLERALLGASLFFLCSCGTSKSPEPSDAGEAIDRLQQKARERAGREAEPLVGQGHELWKSGRRAEAIRKYSEIIRIDPSNPYGHFGIGLQASEEPISGTDSDRFAVPAASLRFYLASDADRGSGAEGERRELAEKTLRPIVKKLNKAIEDADGYELHEGLRRVKKADRWGFVDAAGTEVVQPRFESARHFSEGLAPVKQDGRWGYIDKTGKFVISPQYADALSFDRGVAQVTPQGERSGFYRFIDKAGRFTTNPDYPGPSAVAPAPSRGNAPSQGIDKNASIIGTFSGEEGGGSTISVTFSPDGKCVMSQGGQSVPGTYVGLKLPFPEKGNGNVYYEIQPADSYENGDRVQYKSRVGFYSPRSDSFFVVVGDGTKNRLLQVGPHAEFAVELQRRR